MSLDNVFGSDQAAELEHLFESTEAAQDRSDPIPRGRYELALEGADFGKSQQKGTPCIVLVLMVTSGDHEGRKIWHQLWLTENAMAWTKRDLAKFGINHLSDMNNGSLPRGAVVKADVVVKQNDDGKQWNEITGMDSTTEKWSPGKDAFDESDAPAPSAGDGVPPDEDIPFAANKV